MPQLQPLANAVLAAAAMPQLMLTFAALCRKNGPSLFTPLDVS